MAAFNVTLNHEPYFLRVMKLSFMLQRSSSEENLFESTALTVTLGSVCLSQTLNIKVSRYHSAHTELLTLQVIHLLLILNLPLNMVDLIQKVLNLYTNQTIKQIRS